MAHGMAVARETQGTLWTWEAQKNWAAAAAQSLQAAGAETVLARPKRRLLSSDEVR